METNDHVLQGDAKAVSAPADPPGNGSNRRVLRVWLVEDNAELREPVAELLNHQPGIRCKRQFASAEAILATLAEERPPDVILLDINLGGRSGLSAIQPIKKLAPSVKVLMWTMFSNSHYEAEAFRLGANAFLLKSYEIEQVVKLMREAYRNPDAPGLFPHIALRKSAGLELVVEEAGATGSTKRLSLVGALRQLCGSRRRQVSR